MQLTSIIKLCATISLLLAHINQKAISWNSLNFSNSKATIKKQADSFIQKSKDQNIDQTLLGKELNFLCKNNSPVCKEIYKRRNEWAKEILKQQGLEKMTITTLSEKEKNGCWGKNPVSYEGNCWAISENINSDTGHKSGNVIIPESSIITPWKFGSLYHEIAHVINGDTKTTQSNRTFFNTSWQKKEKMADLFAIKNLNEKQALEMVKFFSNFYQCIFFEENTRKKLEKITDKKLKRFIDIIFLLTSNSMSFIEDNMLSHPSAKTRTKYLVEAGCKQFGEQFRKKYTNSVRKIKPLNFWPDSKVVGHICKKILLRATRSSLKKVINFPQKTIQTNPKLTYNPLSEWI